VHVDNRFTSTDSEQQETRTYRLINNDIFVHYLYRQKTRIMLEE